MTKARKYIEYVLATIGGSFLLWMVLSILDVGLRLSTPESLTYSINLFRILFK